MKKINITCRSCTLAQLTDNVRQVGRNGIVLEESDEKAVVPIGKRERKCQVVGVTVATLAQSVQRLATD
jgi:hypothetical protein